MSDEATPVSAAVAATVTPPGPLAGVVTVFRREFGAYFTTPVAAIFLVIFLVMAGVLTFNVGNLIDPRGQASLRVFFNWHPWMYLFLVPALSMRLWADEHRLGTLELLTTLPLTLRDLVVGKFLAAWAFAVLALALTFPVWLTISFLGDPDHGVILAGYFGSALLSGGLLAVGCAVSAASRSQVVAFVLAVAVSFFMLLTGWAPVQAFFQSWMPQAGVEALASVSFLTHFRHSFLRGVVDLRNLVFFCTVIAAGLWITGVLLRAKRQGR